jgi:hypothetical protein
VKQYLERLLTVVTPQTTQARSAAGGISGFHLGSELGKYDKGAANMADVCF